MYIYIKRKTKEAQKTFTHTSHARIHVLKTSREFSNFNVYFLDIHRNLFELCFSCEQVMFRFS